MIKILLLVILLILSACSDRERANPFDPGNPDTHGAPVGLRIQSDRKKVELSWKRINVELLLHYNVYRTCNSGPLILYDTIPATQNILIDRSVEYDSLYTYRVQAVTESDSGALSESIRITPGHFNFIITDFYNYKVNNIGYDGNHSRYVKQFSAPIAIERIPGTRTYLLAEYLTRRVYYLSNDLEIFRELRLADRPLDLAVDSLREQFYVLGLENNRVSIYNFDGTQQGNIQLPFSLPFGSQVVYDPIHNFLWINIIDCDTLAGIRNVHSNPDFLYKIIPDAAYIYADPQNGGCWAASDSGIYYTADRLFTSRFLENYRIRDLSINPITGDVYYTGYNRDTHRWSTGYLERYTNYQQVEILGNDYPYLYRIKVIPASTYKGLLVFQISEWRLIRFGADGSKIGSHRWYGGWMDIVID